MRSTALLKATEGFFSSKQVLCITFQVTKLSTDRLSGLQVKENNYRGHGDSVDQLCWHPTNPDLFVTASGDKTIRIWDVRTTKCIATVNTKGPILL